MNLLLVVFLCSIVLLALDLLTAPKRAETAIRPKLKESHPAA
jgi:hypothetical protein